VPSIVRAPLDFIFPESGDIFGNTEKSVTASGAEIANGKPEAGEFKGLVVADEPRAADAARQILIAGGSAVDAATALYFTLSVTYPSAAGLGAQGVCLAKGPGEAEVVTADFAAKAAPDTIVAPGAVRAFGILHSRMGRLAWAQVVSPAEIQARLGIAASRATARSLAAGGPALLADGMSRAVFARFDGGTRGEGETIQQPELAATLEQIRLKGPIAMVKGPLAVAIAQDPSSPKADNFKLAVSAAALGPSGFEATTGAGPAPDLSATSFSVVGRYGDAVACSLSMGRPFGTKRMIGNLGFSFATASDAKLTALIQGGERTRFAGAAGGASAVAALKAAASAGSAGSSILGALATNGQSGVESVAAISCPAGLPDGGGTCSAEADPKGAGAARVALRLR
jgi:gamma-glutamyltranspeptidase/glutathione hydrolase